MRRVQRREGFSTARLAASCLYYFLKNGLWNVWSCGMKLLDWRAGFWLGALLSQPEDVANQEKASGLA